MIHTVPSNVRSASVPTATAPEANRSDEPQRFYEVEGPRPGERLHLTRDEMIAELSKAL